MILFVNDVHKSYAKEKVLEGVSFEIEEPQIIALIGPNGSLYHDDSNWCCGICRK